MEASSIFTRAILSVNFGAISRRIILVLVTGFYILIFPLQGMAQQVPKQISEFVPCLPRAPHSGINTSRLSAKSLQTWCSLERLVYATDKAGNSLYPTLRYLMDWAETSGNRIYIEFPEVKAYGNTAGSFYIERVDPVGIRHTTVIRLYPFIIDQAVVGSINKRRNGLIPFTGLLREERYAEVLGHELGHAIDILSSLERAKIVEEMVEQTNEHLYSFRTLYPGRALAPQLMKLITKRDTLLIELEETADLYEELVWRELRKGRR